MKYNLEINFEIYEDIKSKIDFIKKLNNLFLDEFYKGNKVAYIYQNIKNNNMISFNKDITFYAASCIKVLVCLLLFKKADSNEINLNDRLIVRMSELKSGSGIIKNQLEDTSYSIMDLIKLCLIESDNTAYIKLMEYIKVESVKDFGLSLGAKHTLEGKDLFGIISGNDMLIYWREIKNFIDNNLRYGCILKEYLLKSKGKIIKNMPNLIDKYGEFEIAYHDCGYVDSENPYFIIILTQLNKMVYKEEFVNKAAKLIANIND